MDPMDGVFGNYPASYKQKALQALYLSLRFEVKKVHVSVLTDKTKWGEGKLQDPLSCCIQLSSPRHVSSILPLVVISWSVSLQVAQTSTRWSPC